MSERCSECDGWSDAWAHCMGARGEALVVCDRCRGFAENTDHPVRVSVALEALEAATAAMERDEHPVCPCHLRCWGRHPRRVSFRCDAEKMLACDYCADGTRLRYDWQEIVTSPALVTLRKAIEWGQQMRAMRGKR